MVEMDKRVNVSLIFNKSAATYFSQRFKFSLTAPVLRY